MKKYLLFFLALMMISCLRAQTIRTVAGIFPAGPGTDQLDQPGGIYVDHGGNIYVADIFNNRIQMFPSGSTYGSTGVTVAGGNGPGHAANQLNQPYFLYADSHGNIYVSDVDNTRIQKFPAGSTSATNGITVAAHGLYRPLGVFIDQADNLYVADYDRVIMFPPGSDSSTIGVTVAGGNGQGPNSNELDYPVGVFVDRAGYIYVSDGDNNRVQRFPPGSTSDSIGVTIAGGHGRSLTGAGLYSPWGIFVDTAGYLYVADNYNNRIQKFPPGSDSSTIAVTIDGSAPGSRTAGAGGNASDAVSGPMAVFVDSSGDVYISDTENSRVQKWSAASTTLNAFGIASPVTCLGSSTGSIIVEAIGGTPAYQYKVDSGLYQSSNIFNSLAMGSHTITVRDSLLSISDFVDTVYPLVPLQISAIVTGTSPDSATGAVSIAATGGDGHYTYRWKVTEPNGTIIYPTSQNLSQLEAGSYIVTVTDQNGCWASDTFSVGLTTGIGTISGSETIRIYPNPNRGTFTLESANSIGQPYTISDMLGRVFDQQTIISDRQIIDIKNLSSGSYVLEVKGSKTIRLIVEK